MIRTQRTPDKCLLVVDLFADTMIKSLRTFSYNWKCQIGSRGSVCVDQYLHQYMWSQASSWMQKFIAKLNYWNNFSSTNETSRWMLQNNGFTLMWYFDMLILKIHCFTMLGWQPNVFINVVVNIWWGNVHWLESYWKDIFCVFLTLLRMCLHKFHTCKNYGRLLRDS